MYYVKGRAIETLGHSSNVDFERQTVSLALLPFVVNGKVCIARTCSVVAILRHIPAVGVVLLKGYNRILILRVVLYISLCIWDRGRCPNFVT